MNIILLFAVILAIFFQSIVQKQFNKRSHNQGVFIYNAIACLAMSIVFFVTDKDGFRVSFDLLPYILGFAICFAGAVLFIFLAIQTGALSITCLIKAYSLLVPTFYGIIFLNEKIGLLFWIALVLFVLSILLINLKKSDEKFTFKWLIYAILMVVFNGSASTVQMLQQKRFDGAYKSEFMACAVLISAVFFFALSYFREKDTAKYCIKRGVVNMILMGALLGTSNLLLMILISSDFPTPVIYPVMSGGGVVLATLASVFFYKEKLTLIQWVGLVFGIVSVVLMNL